MAMNVIHSELDTSPLSSISVLLKPANAALLQLRTRLKEVVTGHHNPPRGDLLQRFQSLRSRSQVLL